MTVTQIIDEIKSLPPKEQAGVVRFVYELDCGTKTQWALSFSWRIVS
jgi:hypothetical protein